ncbi:hypothetical protein NDU88_003370 [Pleurodeles waltl]|uniref:Uncharacterized protein n=1 Tax=Pleurodeles waltl TaxID=8319 RepID=A0AAV7TNZ9_PLEWA|nr:hypothetical protein NDU88_003370 [Pleurodeles waltl]
MVAASRLSAKTAPACRAGNRGTSNRHPSACAILFRAPGRVKTSVSPEPAGGVAGSAYACKLIDGAAAHSFTCPASARPACKAPASPARTKLSRSKFTNRAPPARWLEPVLA